MSFGLTKTRLLCLCPSPARRRSPASSFSTGGGGSVFEQRVGTLYVAALLTESFPLGHEGGVVREVRFQRRFVDADPLDDVILLLNVPPDPEQTARLSLQLKHDLDWGDNDLFNEVIGACWERFASDEFHRDFDRFGLVVGVDKQPYRYYKTVISQARASATAADFLQKIKVIEAETCRSFLKMMRERLDICATRDGLRGKLSDEELWRFLRSTVARCSNAAGWNLRR